MFVIADTLPKPSVNESLEELGVTFVVRPEGLDERGGAERSHRPEVVKKPRIRGHILLFSPQASRAPPVRGKD